MGCEAASFLWAVRRVRDDASLGEATASLEGVHEELLIQQGKRNLARQPHLDRIMLSWDHLIFLGMGPSIVAVRGMATSFLTSQNDGNGRRWRY